MMSTHETRPVSAAEIRDLMRLLAKAEGLFLDELERMTQPGNSLTAQRLAEAVLRALLSQAAEDLQAQHQAEGQQ